MPDTAPASPSGTEAELAEARREIAQLQQQLAQSAQALEDFTYSVSHDLRASLRHVNAYLKIMREDLAGGLDSAAIAAHVDRTGEAATQMTRMMDGLMLLSRTGRAELRASDVDLAGLVEDARRQLEHDVPLRPVQWLVAPDLPRVRGDMALLGQMLAQLLGNALKFTRDTDAPRIEIAWSPSGERCMELHIRDNGVGFDPRFQDRLFRVFQRLHNPRQFEGMGVGLALARRVVERHGGSIAAHGQLNGGCQIDVRLPLAAGTPTSG